MNVAGRFVVIVRTWRKTERTRYADYTAARDAVVKARAKGYDARLTTDGEQHPENDPPEFGTSRRRFLIAACMAGWVKPERVVERVLEDVAAEASSLPTARR